MQEKNPTDHYRVRRADWTRDHKRLREIRAAVFVREQQVPLELEWDGRDETARHVLAEDAEGRPIGTGRLLPNGHIGRMAVLPQWRRRGVGSALLAELLRMAGGGAFLNAQSTAVGFYRRHGFSAEGPEFMEAGIPHRRMIRRDDTA